MKEAIKFAMESTWSAIGYDVLQMSEGEAPKDLVIEMVLDANRVETYGHLSYKEIEYYHSLSFEEKEEIAKEVFTFDSYVM